MDIKAIQASYSRWAPIYDGTFGAITNLGRRKAVGYLNGRGGSVLEVGVGTGLALPHYRPDMQVTGIDFSSEMLEKAVERVERRRLRQVRELRQMDARALDFPDNHFDSVAAMHVLSVVPEPERVMAEIARVCKPGGKVVITNHFARNRGGLARLERAIAPLADIIGWHSDFRLETVLAEAALTLERQETYPPFMTFLVLGKARLN